MRNSDHPTTTPDTDGMGSVPSEENMNQIELVNKNTDKIELVNQNTDKIELVNHTRHRLFTQQNPPVGWDQFTPQKPTNWLGTNHPTNPTIFDKFQLTFATRECRGTMVPRKKLRNE